MMTGACSLTMGPTGRFNTERGGASSLIVCVAGSERAGKSLGEACGAG
jgi:hypothetical protein